jgi:membrane protein DedA with SNARE-associated domain
MINSLSIWSYFFLFGIIFFECAGMPLPGFSVALLAAALAGQGRLSFWLVFGATLVAATLGGMAGYLVGIHGGRSLIERYGRYVFITPHRFTTAEQLFQKHGNKAVLLGRFFPLLCFLAGIISGITRLPYRRFLVYNFVGALLWCTQLILGYFFGRSLHMLSKIFNNFFIALIILGLIVGVAFMVRRKFFSRSTLTRPLPLTLEEPTEH